ncbi:uncharacterized protein LOC144424508 [Styela clava]
MEPEKHDVKQSYKTGRGGTTFKHILSDEEAWYTKGIAPRFELPTRMGKSLTLTLGRRNGKESFHILYTIRKQEPQSARMQVLSGSARVPMLSSAGQSPSSFRSRYLGGRTRVFSNKHNKTKHR